jgi:hypothetical protein
MCALLRCAEDHWLGALPLCRFAALAALLPNEKSAECSTFSRAAPVSGIVGLGIPSVKPLCLVLIRALLCQALGHLNIPSSM